jgi:hypothetical protein
VYGNYHLKDGLKENANYKVLDHATWNYLKSLYGAYIDIPRFSVAVPVGMDKTDYLVEINLRKFQIVSTPKVKYVNGVESPLLIFVSSSMTVKELHHQICQTILDVSKEKYTLSSEELVGFSRLWKFEGNETLDDAKDMLSAA